VLLSASFLPAARADDADTTPAPYAKFTAGAQSQSGLFTLWRKNGKVYVELSTAQLGKDFVQSAAPANGLGGWGIVWGEDMFAQTRLIRFTRSDNKIVISWPNTFFKAPEGSARARSVQQSFSPSVVAVTPIVAEDSATGKIIFDGAPFPQSSARYDRPDADVQARHGPHVFRSDEGVPPERDHRVRRDV